MSAIALASPAGPDDRGGMRWEFAVEGRGWDRRGELLDGEAAAIAALGPACLRRLRAKGIPQRTAGHWNAIWCLVVPLDAARAALRHRDEPQFQRAGKQAVAVVLQHCADTGRSYWAWAPWEWARLCGASGREFTAAGRNLPTAASPRPFLIALGYLLCGFTGFHQLGSSDRQRVARLVFGRDAVEVSISTVTTILDEWGYRQPGGAEHHLRGIMSQVLLTNRSLRLADLTTEAFAGLASHPATTRRYTEMLPTLQRVAASLGYRAPPASQVGVTAIEGTAPAWAQ